MTLAGAPTNARPAVRVTDASGAPVAGAEVRFASSSGGTVTGPVRITSSDGIAQVDQWTIATAPGTTTMTASLSGASPVLFTALGQSAAFSIALQNVGPPIAPEFEATLVAARDRWQQIVFRDLPDANGITVSGGTCGTTSTVGPLTIDDVLILVTFTAIDGPGKVLGQAGPCAIRATAARGTGSRTGHRSRRIPSRKPTKWPRPFAPKFQPCNNRFLPIWMLRSPSIQHWRWRQVLMRSCIRCLKRFFS
jgi:hypothetical protein